MSDKVWRCYTTTALYEKETGRFKNIKTTNEKWQEDSFFWKLLHTLIFYIFCIILQRGGVDDIFPSDYDPKPNYPYITLVSIQNYTPQHKADQAGSTNTFIWFHFLLGNANLQNLVQCFADDSLFYSSKHADCSQSSVTGHLRSRIPDRLSWLVVDCVGQSGRCE